MLWFGVSALGIALVLDRVLNGFTRPFWGWISDHIGRYKTMAIVFSLEAAAVFLLLQFIDHPVRFVVLSGLVFFAWGEIYSLFPAAIADVFGPKYATTNYGLQYTAKGTAAIFAGWGAAWMKELTGVWTTVFWAAIFCDLIAAGLAFFWLGPHVARLARERREQSIAAESSPGAGVAGAGACRHRSCLPRRGRRRDEWSYGVRPKAKGHRPKRERRLRPTQSLRL